MLVKPGLVTKRFPELNRIIMEAYTIYNIAQFD